MSKTINTENWNRNIEKKGENVGSRVYETEKDFNSFQVFLTAISFKLISETSITII